jgi:hypothetical protein
MKSPEFVQKFGPVPTQNLQLFRVARWRDLINALDKTAILQTGNYAKSGDIYDKALPALMLTPTGSDADITAISPALPSQLKQGETVRIAVTVKNTGKTAWKNTVSNPAKFVLAAVGDDTTFGITRAYIPDETTVLPGQSFTFHLDLTAPPVMWAGEGKPPATLLPYDLKMLQESIEYFGETLTDHLGATHQIAVANVSEPPPVPFYNATFLSQSLQGDPQINGIRPGAKFAVNLTFKNSGNYTTEAWTRANGLALGSENKKDNLNWGTARISLEETQTVPYGEQGTFYAILTAPETEGAYNFQWQMVGSEWFGQKSDNLVITVSKSAPVIELTDSEFVSIKAPEKVVAGEPFTAEVIFKNGGTTAWTACELGRVVSYMDRTDEHKARITSQHADSIPEETADKLFDNDLSTKYFTRNASAWIQHQFAGGNRYKIVRYAVTSAPDAGPGAEMIANGSFESGDADWKLSSGASISTNSSVSGKSSLMLSQMDRKNIGGSTLTISGLKTNTDYALSFRMKQAPDTQGTFVFDTLDVFDATCQWVKNGGKPTVWTRYRGVFNTAVADAGKTNNPDSVTLRARAETLLGTIYIDDVSLIEVSGGGALGDPQSWTLQGSNDGTNWTTVDTRSGIHFATRNQRLMFDVSNPGEYEYLRFNAANTGGDTLQFGELEYLTEATGRLWTAQGRIGMKPGTTVPPGKEAAFMLDLTAPAVPGDYSFQARMLQKDLPGEGWFGQFTKNQPVTVVPSSEKQKK